MEAFNVRKTPVADDEGSEEIPKFWPRIVVPVKIWQW